MTDSQIAYIRSKGSKAFNTTGTTTKIPATGQGLTKAGDKDYNWTVNGNPAEMLAPGAANWYGGWAANGPDSNWIGIDADKADNGPAPYTFQVQFDLSSFVLSTVVLSGHWAVDDQGTLKVNGNQIAQLTGGYDQLHSFNLAAGSGFLNPGLNTLTITIDSCDRSLEGVRLQGYISGSSATATHTITVTQGANGTIAFSGGAIPANGVVTVNDGATPTFTFTPNSGYQVDDVVVVGTASGTQHLGAASSYQFPAVHENFTLTASFKPLVATYTINVIQVANGVISPPGPVTVNAGDSRTFSIIAGACHMIENVQVDGASLGPIASYTFTQVNADHTISATFKKPGTGDWILNPANGHLYKLVGPGTWQECQDLALAEGADLVTINNAAEQEWLTSTFCRGEYFYIGFTDEAQEGNWVWVSGEKPPYTYWGPGEPNDSGGEDYCIMSWHYWGHWNDCPGTWQLRGIIEKASDWKVNPANGHLYKLVGPATWQECKELARAEGAHLVTINDAQEQQWLRRTFSYFERFHIGFTDEAQEGNWVWVNGETPTYTNWAPGEPNNQWGAEDYGLMNYDSQGRWNDGGGNDLFRAIIEKDGGWIANPANGHYYKLVGPGSWNQCEAQAQGEGAHLVTINNAAEQQWLLDVFGSTECYWIGFTDEAQEGRWVWVSGEAPAYTNWYPGQPDDYGNEDYAFMNWGSQGRWNDGVFNMFFRGIIEKSRGRNALPGILELLLLD
ncbi:MAG: hypothetical protein FJ134_13675 [Deltaproteobacteria bacterium]|nr:hypothetical protein [Deltaproteobacteria bacterium]